MKNKLKITIILLSLFVVSCNSNNNENYGFYFEKNLLNFQNHSLDIYKKLSDPKNKYFDDFYIYKLNIFKQGKLVFSSDFKNQYLFSLNSYSEKFGFVEIKLTKNHNPNDFGVISQEDYFVRIGFNEEVPKIIFYYPDKISSQDAPGLSLKSTSEINNILSIKYHLNLKNGVPQLGYGTIEVNYGFENSRYVFRTFQEEIWETDYLDQTRKAGRNEPLKYIKRDYGIRKILGLFKNNEFNPVFFNLTPN